MWAGMWGLHTGIIGCATEHGGSTADVREQHTREFMRVGWQKWTRPRTVTTETGLRWRANTSKGCHRFRNAPKPDGWRG